ncbi:MAG: hypothetical protein COA38_18705, partial [Fluviicola sp.]
MRSKAIGIVSFFLFLQSYQAASQQEVMFGLSVSHDFSLVSNSQKMLTDQVSGVINLPSRKYPIGLWRTSSIALDSYWDDQRVVVSFGFKFFNYKSVSDSVLPSLVSYPYY